MSTAATWLAGWLLLATGTDVPAARDLIARIEQQVLHQWLSPQPDYPPLRLGRYLTVPSVAGTGAHRFRIARPYLHTDSQGRLTLRGELPAHWPLERIPVDAAATPAERSALNSLSTQLADPAVPAEQRRDLTRRRSRLVQRVRQRVREAAHLAVVRGPRDTLLKLLRQAPTRIEIPAAVDRIECDMMQSPPRLIWYLHHPPTWPPDGPLVLVGEPGPEPPSASQPAPQKAAVTASHHRPAPPATQPADVVYVTPYGKRYHKAGCRWLNDRARALSLTEARAEGYTPCLVCYLQRKPREQTAPSAPADRCQAITQQGTQCRRKASPGSRYCWQHDPTRQP